MKRKLWTLLLAFMLAVCLMPMMASAAEESLPVETAATEAAQVVEETVPTEVGDGFLQEEPDCDWYYGDNFSKSGDFLYYCPGDGTCWLYEYSGAEAVVIIPSVVNLEGEEICYVTTIDNSAFAGCATLTSITIPEGVTTIRGDAFSNCENLTSVHLPNSLVEIEAGAFAGCKSLTELIIPSGVTKIGSRAFMLCYSLSNLSLPEGLRSIGEEAFFQNKNLKQVRFPETLETIGRQAFCGCNNLESVYIPSNVKSIGEGAFTSSSYKPEELKRKEYRVSAANPNFSNDGHGVLFNKDKTVLIQAPNLLSGSYQVPNTVHTIESRSFFYCPYLDEIQIPNSVSSIGNYAFSCSSIKSVTIPASLEIIPEGAFGSCMLKEIILPERLVEIGNGAFSSNETKGTLVIPSSVRKIGSNAFGGNLFEKVVFYGEPPTVEIRYGWSAFEYHEYLCDTYYYYDAENSAWTDEAKIALAGEDSLDRWKPLGASISMEIPSDVMYTYPMICGSVCPEEGDDNVMESTLILKPSESFTNVELKMSLPKGFSFEKDKLVTERTKYFESLDAMMVYKLPAIYPIYVDEAEQTEKYTLTISASATNSTGELWTKTEKEVFYKPSATRNTARVLCPNFAAGDYTFTLSSAVGSGTTYNQETARLCAMMSDMAYEKDIMEVFLSNELGFSDVESYGIFNYNAQACGRYFAHKKIIVENEIKDLVYVVCRGTAGKGTEWIGNLSVGTSMDHAGFSNAAAFVWNDLKEYYKKYHLEQEKTLYLVTGHSKGAAAANLMGHWLNTTGGAGSISKKENVSVYTFATPTVNRTIVNEQAGLAGNENIFNFVNYQDMIRNSPSMQFYGRYGHTTIFAFDVADAGASIHNDGYGSYALPTDGSNFTMLELLNSFFYSNDPTIPSQKGNIIHGLAQMGRVASRLYSSGADWFGEEYAAHMTGYYQAVVEGAAKVSIEDINARTRAAYDYYLDVRETIGEKLQTVIQQFNCPVNIRVYNAEGNEVAFLSDDEITCTDENLIVYMEDSAKVVAYSEDVMDNYTIRVEGYDDGTMTHSILVVGDDGVESLEQRTDIPIVNGGILELNADGYVKLEGEAKPEDTYKRYEDPEEIERIMENLGEEVPEEPTVTRIAGTNRISTAIASANKLKEVLGVAKFDTILVANAMDFPDALSGSYLAAAAKAPILLYANGQKSVTDYIRENLTSDGIVYILGGEKSVSNELVTVLDGIECERVAGSGRFATSLAIIRKADELRGTKPDKVLICHALAFADSLSASATGLPILLVNGGGSLNDDQKAYLESVRGAELYVIGGKASVSEDILTALNAYDANGAERVYGSGRELTSVEVAKKFFPEAKAAALASSLSFPDGLSGGPVAYAMKMPLLLTRENKESIAEGYVNSNGITEGYVIGGKDAVPDAIANAVFGIE